MLGSQSPIDATPLRSSTGADETVAPFLLQAIGMQPFGAGIPWAGVPTMSGVPIMSTVSMAEEDAALHLLNVVVPPVDRLPPVETGGEISPFLRSWLHHEGQVWCVLFSLPSLFCFC